MLLRLVRIGHPHLNNAGSSIRMGGSLVIWGHPKTRSLGYVETLPIGICAREQTVSGWAGHAIRYLPTPDFQSV